ncbi:MAG TPA: 50S ribosomal protein L11 methyltransferase [Clostridia bacterium]|nr:50S ribosomal protein L11 methyltransferase [Clostridia bacterium]HRX41941.1 50S ribosomal protein L11 methyltransferase [Clostridia bacterium]
MKWIEVILESDTDITEEGSYALMEMGATGTRIDNPEEIRSLIEETGAPELADVGDFADLLSKYRVTAYFPSLKNFEKTKGALKVKFPDVEIFAREVDDSQWNENWKKYYKAFQLTEKLMIIPSWEVEEDPKDNEIIMDPGMAFGTGTHESTALCAGLVEENIAEGDTFLDIGTGTGILSIVAARAGAKSITAIDIDEAAVRTARENLTVNKIESATVLKADLYEAETLFKKMNFRAPFVFDVVAANIISDVIIEIAPKVRGILKEGGRFVCSGIIIERENDVMRQLELSGFKIRNVLRKNEWTAIIADA